MGKYYSRKYLNEKYKKAQFDLEQILKISAVCIEDKIAEEDVERVKYDIIDNLTAIINELSK